MARRVNPGITINNDAHSLYFISPRRELASRFAYEMGEYDKEETAVKTVVGNENQPTPEVPIVRPRPRSLYSAYLSLRYIGHEETLTARVLGDFIDNAAVNSLATDMLSKDLIKAFYDATNVPKKPKKPNFFRRVLQCFGQCLCCCLAPQAD
ncbi:uncharacterized protein LOC134233771 [Saccostrea cucullata]|uniref:uncharacterized protein LOC134233771 n=1 Tax=Saccostrea cuccullata TaxID=36930 RepID=UPI002ECFCEDD